MSKCVSAIKLVLFNTGLKEVCVCVLDTFKIYYQKNFMFLAKRIHQLLSQN